MRRSKHVFLMCPPEYFNVAYIINPWMHGNLRKIDNAVAKQQWRALYDILTDHATVRLVLPQPGSPDMVFTANAGLVRGKRFIVSRFRYPERQAEEPYFADWFMDRGYDVSLMPRDVPFEGAGDAFSIAGGRLWMAHGHRSISQAREVLPRSRRWCLPWRPALLSLDTCFARSGAATSSTSAGFRRRVARDDPRAGARRAAHRDREEGARLRVQRRERDSTVVNRATWPS
jgi:N-dimethylarginine dimethylaminohydrolase